MDDGPQTHSFSNSDPFYLDAVEILPRQLLLKGPNGESSVEPKVMALLVTLAERDSDAWTRGELIDRIWGVEFGGDESLTRAIYGLRKALAEPHGLKGAIKTLPKVGYRLTVVPEYRTTPSPSLSADTATTATDPTHVPIPDNVSVRAVTTSPIADTYSITPNRRHLLLASGGIGVLAAGFGISALFNRNPTPSAPISNGIVILPFSNESGDAELDYLTNGMSAEIRQSMARNQALNVLANKSSKTIQERAISAAEVGREFGVGFILDGVLTRTAGAVRLAVELIEARTGFNRWSQTFDTPTSQPLAVRNRVVTQVSSEISEDVSTQQAMQLGLPTNPAAFATYLRAVDLLDTIASTDDVVQAINILDRALDLDSDFAIAHAARAKWLGYLSTIETDKANSADLVAQALVSAERGVEILPDIADTHMALGWVRFFAALDIAGAQAPYDTALKLGGRDAGILSSYASFAVFTRRHEAARRTIDAAMDLDPLNPAVHRQSAVGHFFAGRAEQALQSLDTVESLQSGVSATLPYWRGRAQIRLGQAATALQTCSDEVLPELKFICEALANIALGNDQDVRAQLTQLNTQNGNSNAYRRAEILAALGDYDGAMDALEQALEAREQGLIFVAVEPLFQPLWQRSDYLRLLDELGFATIN